MSKQERARCLEPAIFEEMDHALEARRARFAALWDTPTLDAAARADLARHAAAMTHEMQLPVRYNRQYLGAGR